MNAALKRNPVFWLMWMIPGAAVLAGLGMVAVAMQGADRALPELYHWEGAHLDADFERAREAARLGLRGELVIANGECRVTLQGADASALQLQLTSGLEARLDRRATLVRRADGSWRAPCEALARGKWRLALQDVRGRWALRAQSDRPGEPIELVARAPDGPAS
jgi:hypothetical protein